MATEISQLIAEGANKLRRVASDPRREAEILLAAALGKPRSYLFAHADERVLDCDATDRYEAYLTRRSHGEPVAYVLGEKEFWSLTLAVTPAVLVPRPETELAVERALSFLAVDRPTRVLDLATGSGAIALALAHDRAHARVIGTDVSDEAVAIARRNAAGLQLPNVQFRVGSWYAPVAGERFDLIVSNPPYIADGDPRVERSVRAFEPSGALFSGATGLEALREVIAGAPAHLAAGGMLVVEHGDRQGVEVRALYTDAGFADVHTHLDLGGLERCTFGRWP